MPVATKQMSVSSYFVNKTLVEHLEKYLENEVPVILNFESGENSSDTQITKTITLYDSQGNETYTSISDYKFPSFRNDIKSISIKFNYSVEKKSFDIVIRFGDDVTNTDLAFTISDDNPQEKIAAVYKGVISILDQNKTINRLFYIPESIRALLILGCLICGLHAISGDNSKEATFIFGTIFYMGVFYFITLQVFKPYSTFDTSKQKQLDSWYKWLVAGLLSFLLFNTFLTSIRKSIFGF